MKKENISSFESVIPTALTVLEPMQYTNLPLVKDFYEWLNEKPKVSTDISFAVQLEARHIINNELVKKEGITQMLELASGFLFRGTEFCEDKNNVFVELDLPQVIELKNKFLKEKNIKSSKNWHMVSGNALNSYDFCEKYFDETKPVAVVHQGMLRYFTFDEKRIVAENVKKLLQKHGGVWVTCDFTPAAYEKDMRKREYSYSHKMDELTDRYNLPRFDDIDHVKNFLKEFGFEVEVHKQEEVFDKCSSLKILSKEQAERGKSLCENVVICVIRLK